MTGEHENRLREKARESFEEKHPAYARIINYYENYTDGFSIGFCQVTARCIQAVMNIKKLTSDEAITLLYGKDEEDLAFYRDLLDDERCREE